MTATRARDGVAGVLPAGGSFEQAARSVLRHLKAHVPMAFWAVTRVENGRQTYLVLEDDAYGLSVGGSHAWESSFCIHMAAGTAPPVAPDAQAVPLYAQAGVNAEVRIGAYAGAAVREPDGAVFGAICGLDPNPQGAGSALAGAGPLLVLLGELLTSVLAAERARERASEQALAAEDAADRDALTGLHNRRFWDRALAEEDARFRALADPTVVVVLDLDALKQVNDSRGHAAGDVHLRAAADALRAAVRSSDVVARLGGDEFGLLLRGCDRPTAAARVAAVQAALTGVGVPASVGWQALAVGRGVPAALAAADEAMYVVKRERRIARLVQARPDLFPAPRADDGCPARTA